MDDLIKKLQEIDLDFYKGHYTVGERYDLVSAMNKVLTDKKFI